MSDREALAAALEDIGASPYEYAYLEPITAAARERLAQLPEKCEHRESRPHQTIANHSLNPVDCPGKLYPAELVERLKVAIGETFVDKMGWGESKPMAALEAYAMAEFQAVAVLDALNETP